MLVLEHFGVATSGNSGSLLIDRYPAQAEEDQCMERLIWRRIRAGEIEVSARPSSMISYRGQAPYQRIWTVQRRTVGCKR
jgi:hypothetical protein